MSTPGHGRGHSSPSCQRHKPSRWHSTRQIRLVELSCFIASLAILSSSHVSSQSHDIPPPLGTPPIESDAPDDCEACKLLVKSFDLGFEKTSRGKHEGGDTHWEERNLKSYADSEIRLVEIQEDLCNELTKGKPQCLKIAEEGEADIEEWWFKHRTKNVRLHDYLCINKLKRCCPESKYGPTCQDCMSDCNGRGKCDGSGTRQGTGECNCQSGYIGRECDTCHPDYFILRTGDESRFECQKCHRACDRGCDGPTSANCTECKAGYRRNPDTKLCIDINECELSPEGIPSELGKGVCPEGTYCVNLDGLYKCSTCHQACATCLAYGPDKCLACAENYVMDQEQHICRHFSKVRMEKPHLVDTYTFLKGTLFQADFHDAVHILQLVILACIILWNVYENLRWGRPFYQIRGMAHIIAVIGCSGTLLWYSDTFSNAIISLYR